LEKLENELAELTNIQLTALMNEFEHISILRDTIDNLNIDDDDDDESDGDLDE
jgi:hypothetical protein